MTAGIPQPIRPSDNKGWLDLGPRNINRDRENPDILIPRPTDNGTDLLTFPWVISGREVRD